MCLLSMGGGHAFVLCVVLISSIVTQTQCRKCKDFGSLTDDQTRDIYVYVTSERCGTPVEDVQLRQICKGGPKEISAMEQNIPGLYKYIGPKTIHRIRIQRRGFNAAVVKVRRRYRNDPVVVRLPCSDGSKVSECRHPSARVTIETVCPDHQPFTPLVFWEGPVTAEHDQDNVYKVSTCPSCTGVAHILLGNSTWSYPVALEDQVITLECGGCPTSSINYTVQLVSWCSDAVTGATFTPTATEIEPGKYDVSVCNETQNITVTVKLPIESDLINDVVFDLPASNDDILTIETPCLSNHMGTEFMLGFMTNFDTSFVSRLYITAMEPTEINVRIPYLSLDFKLPVNGQEYINLDGIVVLYQEAFQVIQKGVGITSDLPISLYYEKSKSTTFPSVGGGLVFPAKALGKMYILDTLGSQLSTSITREALVCSMHDGTSVMFNYPDGSTTVVLMDKYDVYEIMTLKVAGTIVSASNDVGVQVGHVCANVPQDRLYCDMMTHTIPPIEALQNLYIVPLMWNRPGFSVSIAVPYDETLVELSVNGIVIETLTLNKQDVVNRQYEEFTDAVVVESSKAVMVTQYGHGSGRQDVVGDPSLVVIPAPSQYTSHYLFPAFTVYDSCTVCVVIEDSYTLAGLLLNDAAITPERQSAVELDDGRNFNIVYFSNLGASNKLVHSDATAIFGAFIYCRVGNAETSMTLGYQFSVLP